MSHHNFEFNSTCDWNIDTGIFPRGVCHHATHENGGHMVLNNVGCSSTVAVAVVVHAGARNERIEEAGIAHVIEHIAFLTPEGNPSPIWFKNDCGRISNAVTTKDSTRFYTLTSPENALEVLGMLLHNTHPKTLMSHSTDVIQKEVRAVSDEKHMRCGGFTDMYYAMQMHVSNGWPVIGYDESLLNITNESVQRFVKQHYKPENVTIFVCGDLRSNNPNNAMQTIDAFKERMTEHFNDWPHYPDTVADPLRCRMSKTCDISFLHSSDDETSYGYGYSAPGTRTQSSYKDVVTMEVIANILNMHTVSKHLGISMTPVFERMYDPSAFLFVSQAGPKMQQNVLEDVQEVGMRIHSCIVQYLGNFGQEYILNNVKDNIQRKLIRNMQTNMGMVEALADSVGRGSWNEFSQYMNVIQSISLDDIREVSRRWWTKGPVAQLVHSPYILPIDAEDTECCDSTGQQGLIHTDLHNFNDSACCNDIIVHGSTDVANLGIWKHVLICNIEDIINPLCEQDSISLDVKIDGKKLHLVAEIPETNIGTACGFLTTAIRSAINPSSVIKGLQKHCYKQVQTLKNVRTSGYALLCRHLFADNQEHIAYFMLPNDVAIKSAANIPVSATPLQFNWTVHGTNLSEDSDIQHQLITCAQPKVDVLAPLRIDASLRQHTEDGQYMNKMDAIQSRVQHIGNPQNNTQSLNFVGIYDMPSFQSFCIAGGLHIATIEENSHEHLCLGTATRCLGNGFHGKLMEVLRSDHHLTYGAYSDFNVIDQVWCFSLTTACEDVNTAHVDVTTILRDWLETPCTTEEFNDQKRIWSGQILNTLDDPKIKSADMHNGNKLFNRANLLNDLNVSEREVKNIVQKHINLDKIQSVMLGPIERADLSKRTT